MPCSTHLSARWVSEGIARGGGGGALGYGLGAVAVGGIVSLK